MNFIRKTHLALDRMYYGGVEKTVSSYENNIEKLVAIMSAFLFLFFISQSFDFSLLAVKTSNFIYHDFAGGWRYSIELFNGGLAPYYDFEYTYPPLGLVLTSCIFHLIGDDIFFQSIFTATVALCSVITLFFISKRLIENVLLQSIAFLSAFILLLSTAKEWLLGGNPFLLWFGFLFFLLSCLLLVQRKFLLSVLAATIAFGFKHEFWIPASLIILICFTLSDKKLVSLFPPIILVGIFYYYGYLNWEIVSGHGRTGWARGQFHWQALAGSALFSLPVIFAKYSIRASLALSVLLFYASFNLKLYDIRLLDLSFFFIGFLFILSPKCLNIKFLFMFLILTSLQIRRGFEFTEPTYLCLLPIFLAICLEKFSNPVTAKRIGATIFQLLLLGFFMLGENVKYSSPNRILHQTEVGNIMAPDYMVRFEELYSIVKGRTFFCIPFCSGTSLFVGGLPSWKVLYLYDRDTVTSFDSYNVNTNLGLPEVFVVDKKYMNWNSYPKKQEQFKVWTLARENYNFSEGYPEIQTMLGTYYQKVNETENFDVYKLINESRDTDGNRFGAIY